MINFSTKKDGAQVVNTYINGKKSAIQLEGGHMFLMSHCKDWDGTRPAAMHGWKFGRDLGTYAEPVDVDIIKTLLDAANVHVNEITFDGEELYSNYRANIHTKSNNAATTATAAQAATAAPTTNNEPQAATAAPTTNNEPQAATAAPANDTEAVTATAAQAATAAPTVDAATAALTGLFGGVAKNVTAQVMAAVNKKLEPILNAAPVVSEFHVIDLAGNTHVSTQEIHHKQFEMISNLVANNIPVYLYGPAGSGKSEIARQVAESLGLDFHTSNCLTQEYKLTGFIDAGGNYHETEFYKAFKNGGLFLLDEMDASVPEVLTTLNAALANGYFEFPNGRIQAHKDFRVIATGNTVGTGATEEYNSRYQLDAASRDRFFFVEIDYDPRIEERIAGGDKDLLNFIRDLRGVSANVHISLILGYRAIKYLHKVATPAMLNTTSLATIINGCITKGLGADELNVLAHGLTCCNKYSDALDTLANCA